MTEVEKRNVEILKESGFWEKYGNPSEIHAVIDMVRADERKRVLQAIVSKVQFNHKDLGSV
jgi:hypothetical protein